MKHKFFYLILLALAVIVISATAFTSSYKKITNTRPVAAANGFAVVELFTSEGCSSCPSAEEAVAKLAAKNTAGVYVLSYHVDYWDRLGWKDQFSNAAYTQKQHDYATAFNLNSVYTPQAVVNGATEFVGSDEGKLSAAVNKNLMSPPVQNIGLILQRNELSVTIQYSITGNNNNAVLLNIALVQPEATVSIKRGENGGRTLHHVNIVRAIKTVDGEKEGTVTLEIPADIKAIPLNVVAYTQVKKSLQVTGAQQKSL